MPVLLATVWQLLQVLRTRIKEAERWRARFQSRTAANFRLRISLLLAFSFLNVVVGAVIYRWSTSDDWSSALFTVYAVLYGIPGSDVTNAPTLMGTVVLNLIFIFGLLVFATILAMITEEVNSLLLAARSGKAPLALSGHIMLLNWNQQVSFILDQLERVHPDHPFAGRPIVILAERDKDEMDGLVVSYLKKNQLEVHTRTGKPYKLEHLERVSAADAAAVLLLHPETSDGGGCDDDSSVSAVGAGTGGDDDPGAAALKMQTIMALTSQLLGKTAAVVVQVPESSKEGSSQLSVLDEVLQMAGHPTNLLNLPVKRMVNSLAVQTTLQPWSATIYHSILQYGQQPSMTFVDLTESLCKDSSSSTSGAGAYPYADNMSGNYSSAADDGADSLSGPSGYKAAAFKSSLSTSYEDVRVHFASELLMLGFIRNHQLVLNPKENSRLIPGDVLVALSMRADSAAAAAALARRHWLPHMNLPALDVPSLLALLPKRRDKSAADVAGMTPKATAVEEAGNSNSSVTCCTNQQQQEQQPGALVLESIHEEEQAAAAVGVSGADVAAAATSDVKVVAAVPVAAAAGGAEAATAGAAATAATSAANTAATTAEDAPLAAADCAATAAVAVDRSYDLPAHNAAAASGTDGDDADIATVDDAATGVNGQDRSAPITDKAAAVLSSKGTAVAAKSVDAVDVAAAAAIRGRVLQDTDAAAAHQVSEPIKTNKHSSFAKTFRKLCCMAAPAVSDDNESLTNDGSSSSKGAEARLLSKGGSKAGSTSFKQGAVKFSKGVTGAVTAVTGTVTSTVGAAASTALTAATTVTGAVTTVAEGAANISKAVVTGAVSTVADGALAVTQGAMTAVTTVADGAVNLSKGAVNVVTDSAVSLSKGAVKGVTTVTGAVTAAVTTTAGLVKSELVPAISLRKDSETVRRLEEEKAAAQQTWAPTSWIFGAGKKQQQSARVLASVRLAQVPEAAARAPPSRKLKIVVAGFSVAEAAADLLPHFLAFAPPGSSVVFTVKDQEMETYPPAGIEWEGEMEEVEDREDADPITHNIKYKFLPAASPLSRETLAAANLLEADAVLLAAEEALRSSPAAADAQVLGTLVEVQHLLASARLRQGSQASLSATSICAGNRVGSFSPAGVGAAATSAQSVEKIATLGGFKSIHTDAATVAGSDQCASSGPAAAKVQAALLGQQQQELYGARTSPPHIVACVATSSSKSVAAAFFGAPKETVAGKAAATAAAAADSSGGKAGVVGQGLFTYELIVPGEVEGSVLVQVANEPEYVKVVTQLLASSEGCELYLLNPSSFGFSPGEVLSFAEVQEVGRLIRKTVLGVVAGGQVVLVPDMLWRWTVTEQDRIAAIADSW